MTNIIALWHGAGRGKSSSLRNLANLFDQQYQLDIPAEILERIEARFDFQWVFEINGVTVAILSQGDPRTNLERRLRDLIAINNCNLIFCATRTRGETVRAVENVANAFDTNIIWTSTYQPTNENDVDQLNEIKAQHLLDLVHQMGYVARSN